MKAPNKIWLSKFEEDPGDNEYRIFEQWSLEPISNAENEEYIRKDIVDETIKTAEEHAYFAGQEKFREELIEWAKFVLKCQEEELAKYDGPSYMKASIMGRIDAYKVLIAKLNSL